jgi:CDP-diacylglycerol--glycerol-3-phosphate 3-phosphatidyltransferase
MNKQHTISTLPNLLTLLRIAAIPIMVLLFYMPVSINHILTASIFAIAALTDWLDGYLARYWQQITKFGAFFDPVADKLLVSVALCLLLGEYQLPYLTIPAAVIIGREIVISALREWMAELGKRASVAVSYVGKTKTNIQMIALTLLLLYKPSTPKSLLVLGYVLLYTAVILTFWSMVIYLKTAWPELLEHSE